MILIVTHPQKDVGPYKPFDEIGDQQLNTIRRLISNLVATSCFLQQRNFNFIACGFARRYREVRDCLVRESPFRENPNIRTEYADFLGWETSNITSGAKDGSRVMIGPDGFSIPVSFYQYPHEDFMDGWEYLRCRIESYPDERGVLQRREGDQIVICGRPFTRTLHEKIHSGSVYEAYPATEKLKCIIDQGTVQWSS